MAELSRLFVEISSKFDTKGVDAAVKSIEDAEKKIKNVSDGFKTAGIALTAFAAGGVILIRDLVKSISAQELAEAKLSNALKQVGIYTEQVNKQYLEYANNLQKTTKYSDDAVIAAESLLTQLGVMPDMMNEALKATTNLSSALGMDLQSAATLVGKAAAGQVQMFSRYGVVLDDTKVKSEGLSYVLGEINKKFGGAAVAEANTFTGQIERLINQIDDLKEILGKELLPTISKFISGISQLVTWFSNLSPALITFIAQFGMISTAVAGVLGVVSLVVATLPKLAIGINTVTAALKLSGPAITMTTGIVGALAVVILSVVEAYDKWQEAETKRQNEALKNASSGANKVMIRDMQIQAAQYNLNAALAAKNTQEAEKQRKTLESLMRLREKDVIQRDKEAKQIDEKLPATQKVVAEEMASEKELYDYKVATKQLSLTQQLTITEQEIKSHEKGTKERIRLEQQLYDIKKALREKDWTDVSNFLGNVQNLYQNLVDFQNVGIENNKKKDVRAANDRYAAKKASIEKNITDEAERTKQLAELEQAHSAEVSNIEQQADTEARARRAQMKPVMIAQAIANTAQGFTKALAEGGIFGIITGAIVAAAGAMQVATIQAQEFAQGGMVTRATPAIFGEAGPEIALPLNNPKTTEALSKAMSQTTNIGGNNLTINISDSILSNRSMLRENAKIISNEIFKDIKTNRKVK